MQNLEEENLTENQLIALGLKYYKGKDAEHDLNKSIYFLEKASKLNSPAAMLILYEIYKNNNEIEKAIEMLLKADKLNFAPASHNLGVLYQQNSKFKDIEKAIYYYKRSANNEFIDSMYNLALIYELGEDIEQNLEYAISLYKETEELMAMSYVPSLLRLAGLAIKGLIPGEKSDWGVQLYEHAAGYGNPVAMYKLGLIYQDGNIVEKDIKSAVKWYKKAAKLDYASAINDLGILYMTGDGVNKNLVLGLKLYKKSAKLNDRDAMYNLGYYYHNNEKDKNIILAIKWFKKAAKLNDAESMYALGLIYSKENKENIFDIRKSIYWLKKAMNLQHSESINLLGEIYFKNAIGQINFLQNDPMSMLTAAQLFKYAASLKNEIALDNFNFIKSVFMKNSYNKNEHVNKEIVKALEDLFEVSI